MPVGVGADLQAACHAYEATITAAAGVDVQILGIGRNGHLGFNEPGSDFASRTRVATLSEQSRRDNARFFNSLSEVPTSCVTQGLGTIMQARAALLIAIRSAKADAIAAMVEGPVDTKCPASLLQLNPDATVICDRAAAHKVASASSSSVLSG